jgi:hypothetical protein
MRSAKSLIAPSVRSTASPSRIRWGAGNVFPKTFGCGEGARNAESRGIPICPVTGVVLFSDAR